LSNDVVRYNNGFNTVPLRQFTPVEMDIFWSVCSKMKRKGTKEVRCHLRPIKKVLFVVLQMTLFGRFARLKNNRKKRKECLCFFVVLFC